MKGTRFFFLLAIIWGTLASVVYLPNELTIFLALLVPLFSFTLGWNRRLFSFWLLTASFFLYALWGNNRLNQQTHQQEENKTFRLLVQADQVKVNEEGTVSGRGVDENGQKLLFFYRCHNQAEVTKFDLLRQPVKITGPAERKTIMPATNDYQFDFKQFWRSQKVTQQLSFQSVEIQEVEAENLWQAFYFKVHQAHKTAELFANRLPNPLRDYSLSLLLGSKESQLYEHNPQIAELGLIHLFALSGLHVSFFLTAIQWLTRSLRITREVSDGLIAVLLPIFYLFTGAPVVLFRALVAGEIRIISRNFGRPVPGITVWSGSLLLSLLVYSQVLLTMGGRLSFALTFAILQLGHMSYWKRGIYLSLVTFPIILAHQYAWNVWQTLANLIAVPVFSTVILPATLLGYFIPGLDRVMNFAVFLFDKTVETVGKVPGQIVLGAFPWPSLLLLFLLPWFILAANKKVKGLLCGFGLLLLMSSHLLVRFPVNGEWTTFDIGQGDAAVLIEPRRRSVTLIDTGGKVSFGPAVSYKVRQQPESASEKKQRTLKKQEGLARNVILPYLHARGISRINTLALSHQDQDHIGDARVILKNFKVDQLVMPAGMGSLPAYQKKIRPYLRGTKVIEATDQTRVASCPLKIVYPFETGTAGNDDSLAWVGRLGGKNIYTAGDLDQAGEKKILEKYPGFAPDIVKFGHHGSKTSTDEAVFARWQPSVGIVSAGRNSRYGHPHRETLEVAAREKMIVYNTQSQGMLRYVYQKNHGHFEVTLHDPAGLKSTN
ncbi:DNA internalization-related competence protein ComEC/Rec2 [Fructobacillus durionis]|uniref:Competence protein ComEC n=1 Tax=Fructobacillus durionis TaxID=283737 RepID=A0A1I1E5V0_9LACO|nr:DNA internalization-related competence protein ComEC/Rec2 [Fructobacillus durionis]SFB80638.1 competence protein ComEC [Fructobacillus durionis]